jgi:hypothetical protein
VYDDSDPGVYDAPPSKEVMDRAKYARRAHDWESTILSPARRQVNSSINECADRSSSNTASSMADQELAPPKMPAEDLRNSALNLLFLLAQTYHKVLECVISTATRCCALDLELNESYFWTIENLTNLLEKHDDLRDFPVKFKPAFHDLYPATIRDVDWEDMVAPDVEQFLSAVHRYVRSKGIYSPEQSSPAWGFVEMFRPSVNRTIDRAVAYNKRMREFAPQALGEDESETQRQAFTTTTHNSTGEAAKLSAQGAVADPIRLPRAANASPPTTLPELTETGLKATDSSNDIQINKTIGRRAVIDAFINKVSDAKRKITRKDIWTVAGYQAPTEFERYQRHDLRATTNATTNFERVLSMDPSDFIVLLEKRKLKK